MIQKILSWLWKILEKIVRAVMQFCFHLLHRELEEGDFENIMQFVRFGIVGVSNTIISYAIYMVSLLIFKGMHILPTTDYFVAQIIAFLLSVLWSFFWNNKMVFVKEEGQERVWWKALLKTYVSYSFTGLFLNSILIVLWVQVLHISEFIAPIINLLISVPVNFLINKFWAFK